MGFQLGAPYISVNFKCDEVSCALGIAVSKTSMYWKDCAGNGIVFTSFESL